jgi:ABC-type sugar transport system substrate-binding protein
MTCDEHEWAKDPLGRFWVTGTPGDTGTVKAYVELDGEAGESVRLLFTDPGAAGAIAEMLWECAVDLAEAEMCGIDAVVERKGRRSEVEEELTVADILDNRGGSEVMEDIVERRPDIVFPWSIDDEDEEVE